METVKLNNGVEMPMLGYGVYQIPPAECACCVQDAIRAGYRLIDTAQSYDNEYEVGEAVSQCGLPRSELFLTSSATMWTSSRR